MKYLKTFENHDSKPLIFEEGKMISDPEEMERLQIEADKVIKPKITGANSLTKEGEPLKIITDKEIKEMCDYVMSQPITVTSWHRDDNRKEIETVQLEYLSRKTAMKIALWEITGRDIWLEGVKLERFLEGLTSMHREDSYWIAHEKGRGKFFD
jgi:hypothetical protein